MERKDGFEVDENGDVIIPDDFDFGVFYVEEDFKRLRTLRNEDVLIEAVTELMLSRQITEEQLNAGLVIIRDKLREWHWD